MNVDLLFVGLIFVGLFLTIKVTTEGLRQVNEQNLKLTQFQLATQQCQLKVAEDTEHVKLLEEEVKQQERDFAAVADKENSLKSQVRELKEKAPKRAGTTRMDL
ncbi:MAG: hypothetical protein ACI8V2_002271 [Candidatus Latescibacterota bacterium]|jgi:hypothetical protein